MNWVVLWRLFQTDEDDSGMVVWQESRVYNVATEQEAIAFVAELNETEGHFMAFDADEVTVWKATITDEHIAVERT